MDTTTNPQTENITPQLIPKRRSSTKIFVIFLFMVFIIISFCAGFFYQKAPISHVISSKIPGYTSQTTVQTFLQSQLLSDATLHIRGTVTKINGDAVTITDGKNSFTQAVNLNIPISTEVLVNNQIKPVHLSVHDIHIKNIVVFSYDYITPQDPQLKAVSVIPQ